MNLKNPTVLIVGVCQHMESCQDTVPEAIIAFLEAKDFEDVLRTAVSLGGDCDTLTAIAASIGEAYYGIPTDIRTIAISRIPDEFTNVLKSFDKEIMKK